ncbi:hypothetical protein DMUE_4455, partial [Dictyocoela muelleri]
QDIKLKGLYKKISQISKECQCCQINKQNTIKYCKLKGSLYSENKLEIISSDISGHFVFYSSKVKMKFYICTFTDFYTRFTIASIIKNLRSFEVIKAFKSKFIEKVGIPKRIIPDLGRQYTSSIF